MSPVGRNATSTLLTGGIEELPRIQNDHRSDRPELYRDFKALLKIGLGQTQKFARQD
jgi:hypothetical protein